MVNNTEKRIRENESIYLRQINISDANDTYCRWMNDPEVMQYLESRFRPHSIKMLENYINTIEKDDSYVFLAIIEKESKTHIGNIKLGPINRMHRYADIGIIIGEKTFWGKGFGTQAISLLAEFAFNILNLHKVTAGAYATNLGSIKAFQKAGFKIEGRRIQHNFFKGKYVDGVLLYKLNE